MGLVSRLKRAWNAFLSRSPTNSNYNYIGQNSYIRPDRTISTYGRTGIINSIYNRIAVDIANIGFRHVKVDKQGKYLQDVESGLNDCLNVSANLDQTGFDLIIDMIISLLDEGYIAILPIDVDTPEDMFGDLFQSSTCNFLSLRIGKIKQWYPQHVRVEAYDENDGQKKEIVYHKSEVAIVENPFYLAMNSQDSTAKRLNAKCNLLDAIDNKSGSDRLDIIVQMPYGSNSPRRIEYAKQRHAELESQLANSKYGIGYIEATEKIIQLNRPVENHIQEQIEYLTNMLFSQLGLTQEIMNGTASPDVMQNYQSRTLAPILKAIANEMTRKWLTPTARSQGQKIWFYQNAFELVPVNVMAELVDKLTRNEIMSTNEVRQSLGMKPSDDPRADELRNKNLNASETDINNPELIEQEENKDEQTSRI